MTNDCRFQDYAYRCGYLHTSLKSAAEDMKLAMTAIGYERTGTACDILGMAVARLEQTLARVEAADRAIEARLFMSEPPGAARNSYPGPGAPEMSAPPRGISRISHQGAQRGSFRA